MTQQTSKNWYFLMLSVVVTLCGVVAFLSTVNTGGLDKLHVLLSIVIVLAIIWRITLLQPEQSVFPLEKILHWLRIHPVLLWAAMLISVMTWIVLWMLRENPAYANLKMVDVFSLAFIFWLCHIVLFFRLTSEQIARIGGRLSKTPFTGFLLTLTTIAVLATSVELIMRFTFVEVYTGGGPPWSVRWYDIYWNPINELGYRDYPVLDTASQNSSKTHILAVGDSFTAGVGVKSVDNLFQQQLVQQLGDNYHVNSVASGGWSTVDQLQALETYPASGDIVILSYMLNDIEGAINISGFPLATPPTVYTRQGIIWLIQRFYLAHYLWYMANVPQTSSGYLDSLFDAMEDTETWNIHQQQLEALVAEVESRDAQLVVIIWPFLTDIPRSQHGVRQILNFFEERDIVAVDMSAVLQNEPTKRIIVNSFDPHPNEYAHLQAADALYEVILRLPSQPQR